MIKKDRIHNITEQVIDALTGLTILEAVGVLESVKYSLLSDQ